MSPLTSRRRSALARSVSSPRVVLGAASRSFSDSTAVAVRTARLVEPQCVWQVIGGFGVGGIGWRVGMPSTSVVGVWRAPPRVTLATFAALARPSGRDRRTRSGARALARGTALAAFGLRSAAAAAGFATVGVLLALASCCCAPPPTRLLVRCGSQLETRGYLAIVVGLLGASLALASFALGSFALARIPFCLLGSLASV